MIRKFTKLTKLLRDPLYRRGLRFGVGANIEHSKVLASLQARSVIDIGANRGQFALVARKVFPDADIFSFEPLVEMGAVFKKIFEPDPKVHLIPLAVGPEKSESTLHVSRRADSSSLLPITDAQISIFPGTEEIAQKMVSVAPINASLNMDDLFGPIVMKLDVQGFELDALRGCVELLDKVSAVIVECSFVELYKGQSLAGEVVEFLGVRGFRILCVYNLSYRSDGYPVQCDFAFIRAG